MICEWNLLFWTLPILKKKKKDLSFDDLAVPVQKLAIPQHGLQNKLTKLYNYGHKNMYKVCKGVKDAKARAMMVNENVGITKHVMAPSLKKQKQIQKQNKEN